MLRFVSWANGRAKAPLSRSLFNNHGFQRTPSVMTKPALLTRAKAGGAAKKGGKKLKKKEWIKSVRPADISMDMIAKDWGAWEHGEKIDVSLPWKEGEYPDWILQLVKESNERVNRISDIGDLDVEKHGLRYSWRKVREDKIKTDNELRDEQAWSVVPSLKGKRKQKRKPLWSPTRA